MKSETFSNVQLVFFNFYFLLRQLTDNLHLCEKPHYLIVIWLLITKAPVSFEGEIVQILQGESRQKLFCIANASVTCSKTKPNSLNKMSHK